MNPDPAPELSIYRDHCIALLRRYCVMAIDVGRLPALLGREVFVVRAQTYHTCTFEDTVIFVHDVERCLDRLHPFDRQLIARIILEEYTEEEAARLLHCTDRTIRNRLPDALDQLTRIFLECGLLDLSRRVRPFRSTAGARSPASAPSVNVAHAPSRVPSPESELQLPCLIPEILAQAEPVNTQNLSLSS